MFSLIKSERFSPKMEISGCFVISNEEMLLVLRQDHKPQGNTWGQPAGKVEPGEDPLTSAERELFEETRIKANGKLKHFKTAFVSYPDYDFTYHMFLLVLPQKPKTKVDPNSHKEHGWFKPQEALNLPLVPELDRCIELYISEFLV